MNYTVLEYIKNKCENQLHKFDEKVFKKLYPGLCNYSIKEVSLYYKELVFEIIYDRDMNIIGYRILNDDTIIKKNDDMWIQYNKDSSNKRILFDTQILIIYLKNKRRELFINNLLENI